MFRGRFQLGGFVDLDLLCTDSNGDPVAPDDAPTVTIYDDTGTPVKTDLKMPPKGINKTGYFGLVVFLDSDFSTGPHIAKYSWDDGGGAHEGGKIESFTIKAGGHSSGAYIGLEWYDRPHASFLVGALEKPSTSSGTIEWRRNPYLC